MGIKNKGVLVLVLSTGTAYWYCVLGTGTGTAYCVLVLRTAYCVLVLRTRTAYSYSYCVRVMEISHGKEEEEGEEKIKGFRALLQGEKEYTTFDCDYRFLFPFFFLKILIFRVSGPKVVLQPPSKKSPRLLILAIIENRTGPGFNNILKPYNKNGFQKS